MDISVIVPLYNEDESLPELTSWIEKIMAQNNFTYEILLINDGSTDSSWNVIEELAKKNTNIKGLKFRRNYGKSAALYCGFEKAKGDVVITMDADLQDSPDEIPDLYKMIIEDGYDLVSGWKKKRYDPFIKNSTSKIYNAVARITTGIKLHDFNCGLKAYRNIVIKSIEVYGDMHRYIPVLAKGAGFKNIGEKIVEHRARKFGKTKFGLNRFMNGPLDLLTITFLNKFGKKPMHLFGTMGVFSFIIGFAVLLYLSIEKLVFMQYNMTSRPLFFLGVLCIIFGSQLFLTGFLAELISRNSAERNVYLIDEEVNI